MHAHNEVQRTGLGGSESEKTIRVQVVLLAVHRQLDAMEASDEALALAIAHLREHGEVDPVFEGVLVGLESYLGDREEAIEAARLEVSRLLARL